TTQIIKSWIKLDDSKTADMMKLILVLSAILGCVLVSGYTTEQPNNNPTRGRGQQGRQPLPPCLRGNAFTPMSGLPRMLKTCVGLIIKNDEFRSYLDLDVCQFVKNSVGMGMSCIIKEFRKETGCPVKVVEELMGLYENNNMAMQVVEYMFCDGPNPFQGPPPRNNASQ
ncbi:unnamed protein product, partial [Owenia fusiformis]